MHRQLDPVLSDVPVAREAMRSLVLVLALASLAMLPRPASAAQSKAFVLTSDFMTGGLSVVDLDTRAVSIDVAAGVCSDARIRWHDGLLYIVNRLGCDNILVLDPAHGFAVVRQFSTGNGSNPSDIVFVSPTKAYVPRYELPGLLIVNPSTGAGLGEISLAGLADADGVPEMDRGIRIGDRVFVALQRLDRAHGFQPTDSSLVAVIDARADTLIDADPGTPGVQGIRLTGKNPVTTFGFDPASKRLLIGCAGRFGLLDGGIEWVDPVIPASLGYAITESALGGDVGDFAWKNAQHSYAIVSDASFNAHLVSWSAATGMSLATILSPGGFSLPDCDLDDRGELYVGDNRFTAPGLFVYSTATDTPIAGPLDLGLPPSQITFDEATDQVAAVTPGAAAVTFSPPRPNPARNEASFALTLARAARVRIEVFDPAGRRVRTLAEGERPSGVSVARWDLRDAGGRRVRPGLYLVRATVAEETLVRRLVVSY